MYYKDNNIELRLGLGLLEIKVLLPELYTFNLSSLNDDNSVTHLVTFTSDNLLTEYPKEGNYVLEIFSATVTNYLVYINVNDAFITEFINQVKDIVCGCTCKPCEDNSSIEYAFKRQKLFNTTFILPNTIKPFSYGQELVTNSFLSSFLQLYFNATILDKKTELGKEYFSYYTTGSSANNARLFNTIIVGTYYSLYYYYKTLILLNSEEVFPTSIALYTKTVDDFFKVSELSSCLYCYIAGVDFNTITLQAFNAENLSDIMNQNNFSRTIKVKGSDLSGTGTLLSQIAAYINTLQLVKTDVDSDIWIEYDPEL